MITKKIYIARDGKEFITKEECLDHEKINTPKKIIFKTWIGRSEWSLYEKLIELGYQFNDDATSHLKHALNEIDIKIEVDSETGEVKILNLL